MARILIGTGLSAIALAIAFVSCRPATREDNEGLGIKALSPLNSKQMASMSETIDSIGRIESAALEAKGVTSTPPVADPITSEIKNALLQASCKINSAKEANNYGVRHSFVNIGGDGCPVTAHIDSHYSPEVALQGYTLFARFSITDPSLKEKNDIYELEMTGHGEYNSSGGEGNFALITSGTAKSVKRGLIRISSTNTQRFRLEQGKVNASGNQMIRLSFPKTETEAAFTVELTSTISIQNDIDRSVYFKNGVDISKQEYSQYLAKFGIIFN